MKLTHHTSIDSVVLGFQNSSGAAVFEHVHATIVAIDTIEGLLKQAHALAAHFRVHPYTLLTMVNDTLFVDDTVIFRELCPDC